MTYPGGKNGPGVYQTLINQIPPHDVYCAPFLGHDAILRRKAFASRNIGVELDREVLDWWAEKEIPNLELYACDGIEWLRHQFGYYRHTGTGSQIGSTSRGCDARSSGERSQWFVYVDPPYPMATRSGAKLYTHEFTDNDHVELLKTLVVLPSVVRCMVSSYPNALYEAAFKVRGWRTMTYQSIDRRGNRRTEQLWMNYAEPPVLHDYQFAGRNKREREKLRRRCRNWVGGLRRMKPEHRNALLQAIETEFRPASTNWSALPEG